MPATRRALAVALSAAAFALGALSPGAAPVALEAPVRAILPPRELATWPVLAPDGTERGTADWLVVGGATAFENYLVTTPEGRLVDLGSTFPRYTDDAGGTWRQVGSLLPFSGGEGAIAVAPNGDVVGATWSPWSGDRIIAYKFEAATGRWLHRETPVHTPFFDRPWIAVARGPFTTPAGEEVPYLAVLRGGWPSRAAWMVSFDGLTYEVPSNPALEDLTRVPLAWHGLEPDPAADHAQPHRAALVVPLAGGGAMTSTSELSDRCRLRLLGRDGRWACGAAPFGNAPGWQVLTDSRARVHMIHAAGAAVRYSMSPDGGETWHDVVAPLPYEVVDWDAKTHAAAGLTAVAVHARDGATDTDLDLVVRFDVSGDEPRFDSIMVVGDGGLRFGSGLGSADPRFDFTSIAILPDGRVATVFADRARPEPRIAIQR